MQPPKKISAYDIIVCGAGPVGLLLAGELALAGCAVLVLERAAEPDSPLKRPPFGIRGLSAPTITALHGRGLLDALLPSAIPKASIGAAPRQGGHFAGIPFDEDAIDFGHWRQRTSGALPTTLVSSIATLEATLAERAQERGVHILRGVAVTDVRQSDDGVTIVADGLSFSASWAVGCDGARSRVRKAAGIGFAGTEPEFTGYSVQASLVDPDPLQPGRQITAHGLYVYAPSGYIVIQDFDGGAFHDSGQSPTREHVQAVLRRVSETDVTLGALHVATTWTDRARQATRYRDGRILLAGDAAHIHSPLGGQGLNLGLGDAMNLGWKLGAAVRGTAPADLLDTYHTERHPVGAAVLAWSRAQVAAMRPDAGARALRAVLHDLLQTRDGATYMAGRIRGMTLRYELGEEHPLAGRDVPDMTLGDGTTLGEWLRNGRGVLVDVGGNAELEAFARGYGGRIDYVAAETPTSSPQSAMRAMLVRPDGVVAWACDGAPDAASLERAAGRWFVKPPP